MRRRLKEGHFGEVSTYFFIRKEQYRFQVNIYKVEVNHTIKMKKTRVERTRVRHRDETEMHQVDEKRMEIEPEQM